MRGSTVQLSLKALIRCWALSHNSAGCLMPMSDDLPLPHILAVCDRGVSVNDGHHGLARYSSVAYLYWWREAKLVTLFTLLERGRLESTTDNNIMTVCGMMSTVTGRKMHSVCDRVLSSLGVLHLSWPSLWGSSYHWRVCGIWYTVSLAIRLFLWLSEAMCLMRLEQAAQLFFVCFFCFYF